MNKFAPTQLLAILATVSLLIAQQNHVFAQTNTDEEAIKKVIIDEADAWIRHDVQGWASAWIDSPVTSVANNGGPGIVIYRKGFAELKQIEEKRATLPPSTTLDSREDWHIRVVGNMAWARHIQHFTLQKTNTKLTGFDLKVLEKIDGQWKISTSSWMGDYRNATPPMKSTY